MYRGPILFPLLLVALGFLLLFSNLGYIQFDFWNFIETWWPLLLIILGLDILIGSLRARNVKPRTLALDLGTAPQAEVSINFGAGDLTIGKAAPGKIVDGTFEGEVRYDVKPDGRVWLKLEPLNWWGWNPRGYRWNVGLSDAVPLKLSLDGGAANTNADQQPRARDDGTLHPQRPRMAAPHVLRDQRATRHRTQSTGDAWHVPVPFPEEHSFQVK